MIARKADEVGTVASINAQGDVIGMRSRNLLQGIRTRVDGTPNGVVGTVWTGAYAVDRAGRPRLWKGSRFYYPAYHDVAGRNMLPKPGQKQIGGMRPWLTSALRQVFPP
jgi:hypothetical protein